MGGRLLTGTTALLMLFFLISCGDTKNDDPQNNSSTTTGEQTMTNKEKEERAKELQMTVEYVKRSYEFMASDEGQRILKSGEDGIEEGQERMHKIARDVGFNDMFHADTTVEKYIDEPEVAEWVDKLFNALPQEEIEGM